MASVMLVPTVATHRRMPHLSKKPKKLDDTLALSPRTSSCSSSFSFLSLFMDDATSPDTHESTAVAAASTGTDTATVAAGNSGSSFASSVDSEGIKALMINTATTSRIPGTVPPSTASEVSDEAGGASASRFPAVTSLDRDGQHSDQLLLLLHGPHGQCSALPSLPTSTSTTPLSATSSSLSIPHEFKAIRSALHEAFGCLHHPIQHTHHPTAMPTTVIGRLSTASRFSFSSSVTAGTLHPYFTEVTPMIRISPEDSPSALNLHMSTFTPIKLLEVSGNRCGGHAGGRYLAPSTPKGHNASSGSSSLPCSFPSSSSSRHPHCILFYSPQAFFDVDDNLKEAPKNESSIEFHLNPSEHPVLCSLHTLGLIHSHSPEHYNSHLGHDLSHGCILIDNLKPPTGTTPMTGASEI